MNHPSPPEGVPYSWEKDKKATCNAGSLYIFASINRNLQRVHMKLQTALEVTSLVLVNHPGTSQFVEHGGHLGKQSLCSTLIAGVAKRFHGITCRLMIIPVLQPSGFGLADPLFR